jgi:hypothetical protein
VRWLLRLGRTLLTIIIAEANLAVRFVMSIEMNTIQAVEGMVERLLNSARKRKKSMEEVGRRV